MSMYGAVKVVPTSKKPLSLTTQRTKLKPVYGQVEELVAKGTPFSARSLNILARGQAVMGNLPEAEKTIDRMRSAPTKQYEVFSNDQQVVISLSDIGAIAWKLGDKDNSKRLLDKAFEELEVLPLKEGYSKPAQDRVLLLRMARGMILFKDMEDAKTTLRRAGSAALALVARIEEQEKDPNAHKGEDELNRRLRDTFRPTDRGNSTTLEVAELQVEVGDKTGGRETLNGLTPPATPRPDKVWDLRAYVRYWQARASIGDTAKAKVAMQTTIPITRTIQNPQERADAIMVIAKAAIENQGIGDPKTILGQAYPTIMSLKSSQTVVNYLNDLATLQSQAHDKSGAKKSLEMALQSARSSGSFDQWLLARAAETYGEIGEPTIAKSLAAKISNDLQIGPLVTAGQAYAKSKNLVAAQNAFAEASRSASRMGDRPTRASFLINVATEQHLIGADNAAAITLSLAENSAKAITEQNREDLFGRIAELRASMGDTARASTLLKMIKSEETRLTWANIVILSTTGFKS